MGNLPQPWDQVFSLPSWFTPKTQKPWTTAAFWLWPGAPISQAHLSSFLLPQFVLLALKDLKTKINAFYEPLGGQEILGIIIRRCGLG